MDRRYWFFINNIPGIGNAKIRKLLEVFENNPEEVFKAGRDVLLTLPFLSEVDAYNICDEKIRDDIIRRYDEYYEKGINYVFPHEEGYPTALREIYDRPWILYYEGRLPALNTRSVAIVGARRCSEYGKAMACEFGRLLGSNGINVISGLALGIDSAAHRGAVMAGGSTFAVLAGCADRCYPMSNFNLYMDIKKTGGVISEYPPGTKTVPGMFLMRNRIISGMCESIIVVEAGRKSGSLITAMQGLEQNRQIYAVPGRIGDGMSLGTNELIKEGAQIITGFDDFLTELGIRGREDCLYEKNKTVLAKNEKMLYSLLLDFTPKSIDTLISESGLDAKAVYRGVLELEMKGLIKENVKNFYVRII